MSPTCIDLRERFGRRYRVAFEESYYAEHGAPAHVDDPWLQVIPGRRGHVYPWGGERLAASTNTSGRTAARLKALPGVEVCQDGSDGATVLFTVELLDQVADLLVLRRRRRVTDQERSRLAELGRRFGFQPRQAGLQSRSEARPCVPTPQVDTQDLPRQARLF